MHAVVRRYSGPGAAELFDVLEKNRDEVEKLIRGVSGLVSYTLLRTDDGGMSETVCQDKSGCEESVKVAAEWIRQNTNASAGPPQITEGTVILQLN